MDSNIMLGDGKLVRQKTLSATTFVLSAILSDIPTIKCRLSELNHDQGSLYETIKSKYLLTKHNIDVF
jgi:hypothetical protein